MNFAIVMHMYCIQMYIYLAQRSQGKLLYTKFSSPCLIYVHVLSHWNTGLLRTCLFLSLKYIKSNERRGFLFQYILGFSLVHNLDDKEVVILCNYKSLGKIVVF